MSEDNPAAYQMRQKNKISFDLAYIKTITPLLHYYNE